MDLENNENVQESIEEAVETTETTEYTGCDEDLSQEITDEEYAEVLDIVSVEDIPKKKNVFKAFISGLKEQAVCKLLFLFAAIGFIFPFFSELEKGVVSTFTTGIDTFKTFMFLGTVETDRLYVLIAAFALAVLGFVLTVLLKKEARNIAGFICSLASAVCMGVFSFMLPSMFSEALSKFLVELSKAYSEMYGMAIDFTKDVEMFELSARPASGFWFVAAILVVLVVYFIVQIVVDSKNKAAAEMTLTEGEFPEDFDEAAYDEDLADEIEAALEELAEETEDISEEVTEATKDIAKEIIEKITEEITEE